MRLLTTQEFSEYLDQAYGDRGYGETLGQSIYRVAIGKDDDNMRELLKYAAENGFYLYSWENDLALIKYFIDNFVEEL